MKFSRQVLKSLESSKNWITLMLCVGVIQLSAYYFLGMTVRPDGVFAAAQPDTALYFQAARRIVEGAPFTYSAGEPLCTGTTSVVFPFLLAPLYALGGAKASLTLGYLLNALFYFVFLVCWAKVIERTVAAPLARAVAGVALALFGQSAMSAAAQSDIGLWMAVSAAVAYAFAAERNRLALLLLCLSPWVRPEGVLLALAFAVVMRRPTTLLPLLSVIGVFALNFALTGSCQFSSVQGKGYFAQQPFFSAVVSSALDAVKMFRQLFAGGSSGTFREFFFVPVLGALFFWYHVFTRDYSRFTRRECVFLLAAAGGFATVATSGMQGTNFDRYLAWSLPVVVIWMADGAAGLGSRLRGAARFLPPLLLLLFSVVGAVASAAHFRLGCEQTEVSRTFYERCETVMEPGASVAAFGNSGAAFSFSPRRFAHLYGIYSPQFRSHELVEVFELLKHEPGLRTVYVLYDPGIEGEVVGTGNEKAFGNTMLVGPRGLELRRFDWMLYDRALLAEAPSGLRLCNVLDVGYGADEKRCAYAVEGDYLQSAPEAFLRIDVLNGADVLEVGRVVTGSDAMTVSGLVPGRELVVVMRTARAQHAVQQRTVSRVSEDFTFNTEQRLRLEVDGNPAGEVSYHVPETGFADVTFTVPAEFVTAPSVRFSLSGGHVACAYRFYQ